MIPQAMLAGLPFVKDMHPEQRVARALMWEGGGSGVDEQPGAQSEYHSQGCSLWETGSDEGSVVQKRPGRCAPASLMNHLP